MRAIEIEFELNGHIDFFDIETPPSDKMKVSKFIVTLDEAEDGDMQSLVSHIKAKAKEKVGSLKIYTYSLTRTRKNDLEVCLEHERPIAE